jgi:hypothetical protein
MADEPAPSRASLRPAIETGIASAIALGIVIAVMLIGRYDPVELLVPGSKSIGGEVMKDDFGADAIPDRYAYDGQRQYLIARFFPDMSAAADIRVDEFRMRRVLQPAIASLGGEGSAVVLLLLVLGVLGTGLAAGGLADVAARHGRDARVGFAAPVALAFPTIICTTEPLAFGLAFVGLALTERRRYALAIAAFGLAGLTRETALVMAFAAALAVLLRREVRPALGLALLSPLPFVAWAVILRTQVTAQPYKAAQLFGFFDLPRLTTVDIVIALVTVALLVVGIARWRDVPVLWITSAGFLASCLLYRGDSYPWEAFARLSAAGIAIGLAGLAPTTPSPTARSPAAALT